MASDLSQDMNHQSLWLSSHVPGWCCAFLGAVPLCGVETSLGSTKKNNGKYLHINIYIYIDMI